MLTREQQDLLEGKSLSDAMLASLQRLHNIKIALQCMSNRTMNRLSEAGMMADLQGLAVDLVGTTEWIRNDLFRRLYERIEEGGDHAPKT